MHFFIAILCLVFLPSADAYFVSMTRPVRLNGELVFASFYSNADINGHFQYNQMGFEMIANRLDFERLVNYLEREEDIDAAEVRHIENNLFSLEPLALHDEVLILHRRPEAPDEFFPFASPNPRPGDILGIIATDRLGDVNPSIDFLESFLEQSEHPASVPIRRLGSCGEPRTERFLFEHRLAPLDLQVERVKPKPITGGIERLKARGVYPHWHPHIARHFFDVEGNVMEGDTLHVNAVFAAEGLYPVLHLLANIHGMFSTGRIIPAGHYVEINKERIYGPKVFIPTKLVGEVFNKLEAGVRREGIRTRYYKMARGTPISIGEKDEWADPRLGEDYLVQLMGMGGNTFRVGWPRLFFRQGRFHLVPGSNLGPSYLTFFDPYLRFHARRMTEVQRAHHPTSLSECVDSLMAIPIEIEVDLST